MYVNKWTKKIPSLFLFVSDSPQKKNIIIINIIVDQNNKWVRFSIHLHTPLVYTYSVPSDNTQKYKCINMSV